MEFESEEAAKAFYNSYARRVGFSTRVSSSRRSRRDGAIIQRQFVCAKEGFRNLNEKRTKDREIKRPRTITRVGCKASLSVKMQDSGKWVVSGFVREHNHELVPPDQVHCLRSHRQISGPAKTLIDTLQAAGDEEQYSGNVFWADPKARTNYTYFGDTVTFDTTYRSNRYRLPFAPFTGVNHHGQPVLFGCAFLINETEASFVWLFNTWLTAMSGRHPVSITTDHDAVIRSAIMQAVGPSIFRDTFFAEMSITQRSDSMNSYFDGYVNASTNLNQFFKLYEKSLESRNEKEVKADYDTMNTSPVLKTPSPMEKQASELYTRKLFMRFQEELVGTLTFMASKAEDDGESITYQVAKYGEDHKAYYVKFNVLEMKATCSCQMFEFSGLLCRHVLAVFRVTNVLTLPSHYILKRWTRNAKSSVILEERSTDVYANYLESHTVRYNTLRHEAFKFVDEGSKSLDTYNVAVSALQEAAKRVTLATKNERRSSTVNGRSRGELASNGSRANYISGNHLGSSTQLLSEDDMDKKIQELTNELDYANRKCEVYRANLLSVLKDIEDHKLQLSIKVQNIKISMKDSI
ncbi:hypothetical protein GH714_027936 [Hevea brasiliensis]|uniref:Protein FAR1-RELATED SEQUENCE n=1 Tax=Hevea brasiliensis TaxID=3981 RepID=A0A6A6MR08_HEVBR|nr:hypothetical protein GH714_027936 [Hevea brasiliensis]